MPFKRRRTQSLNSLSLQQQNEAPPSATMPQMQLKLPSPFEFEDNWWSSDELKGGSSAMAEQVGEDIMVDPLLHFPEEEVLLERDLAPALSHQMPATALAPSPAPATLPSCRKRRCGATAASKKPEKRQRTDAIGKSISPRESHILSERQRRKGMNHLFSSLAALLPDHYSKSDKSTIVSEIIVYIHSLHKDLDELGKKKSEALKAIKVAEKPKCNNQPSTSSSSIKLASSSNTEATRDQTPQLRSAGGTSDTPNVVLTSCGSDAFITISSSKSKATRRNLFSKALELIRNHNLTFVDANISSNAGVNFHYFHVKAEISQHLPTDGILQKELQSLTKAESLGPGPNSPHSVLTQA